MAFAHEPTSCQTCRLFGHIRPLGRSGGGMRPGVALRENENERRAGRCRRRAADRGRQARTRRRVQASLQRHVAGCAGGTVDRPVVGGSGPRLEEQCRRRRPRAVVIAGHRRQHRERAAGVDRQQRVEVAARGRQPDLPGGRCRSSPPHRTRGRRRGMQRLADFARGEQVGAGHAACAALAPRPAAKSSFGGHAASARASRGRVTPLRASVVCALDVVRRPCVVASVSAGNAARSSATAPATWGEAWEVPPR